MSSFSKPGSHRRPPSTMANNLRASKSESERDSGFSDASSGYLSAVDLTDNEDMGMTVAIVGQDSQASPQMAVMGGSYPGLSPMIIMNNIVLKQPNPVAPAVKPWGFPSSLEMIPQSQVVLLQPMVPNGNNISPKSAPDNHRQPQDYLPILKSYPKIAPHPGKSSTRRQGFSSTERGSSTPGYGRRHRRHHHGHKLYSSPSPLPGPKTPLNTGSSAEATITQAQLANPQEQFVSQPLDKPRSVGAEARAPPPGEVGTVSEASGYQVEDDDDDGCEDILSMDHVKLNRFCNTYNVLNNSGLLGITLRTKELISQNQRSQGQLQQLQRQTDLFVEALGSGDPQVWTRLQLALQGTVSTGAQEGQCQVMEPLGVLV